MKVLVTGGAGYIGSHVVVELLKSNHDVVIFDNLSNSELSVLDGIERITGQRPEFVHGDISDEVAVGKVLEHHQIDAVMHFAAFKFVGESVAEPLMYYQNNVAGFVSLLKAVTAAKVKQFVFSSTAAVYGTPESEAVTEQSPCNPESPYGWSKRMDEVILADTCVANPGFKDIALRYFNVIGAHDSGLIGESSKAMPQNLLPLVVRAVSTDFPLTVYGTDYPTADGTCLRDYIHVVDLAKAHVAALRKLAARGTKGYLLYNVGTGKPTSVLEMINTFERVNEVKVPYKLGARRPGDPVAYYAISSKIESELGWRAEKTTEDAVRDAWRWQLQVG